MGRIVTRVCLAVAVAACAWSGLDRTAAPAESGAGPAYHCYVGNLHSHTSYSDGAGTPAQAFQYARDGAGIDFLAVTDHNVALSAAEYADILAQADAFNQDGVFVAIGGQEWTDDVVGHCTVLGADHIFTTAPLDVDALYQELLESGCTGAFAHPRAGMFDDWAYSAVGDVGINSVEVRTEEEHLWYVRILNNGWRLGADGSQDNHRANWGDGPSWTIALACSLTRAEILGAIRNFRTYATHDRDLELTFEAGGHMMGEAFSDSGNLDFAVNCHHRGGLNLILRLELYENGYRVAWFDTRTDSILWCPEITPRSGENNYFVRINQESYKRSFTSPMWITCSTPLPSTPALCAPALNEAVTTLSPRFAWHPSDQAGTYTLQYSTSSAFAPGPATVTVAGIEDTCYALGRKLADRKTYFWRVWATNGSGDGAISGTGTFWVNVGVFVVEPQARLTTDAAADASGALLQTAGDLWLAWCTDRDGNREIYRKTSWDGGETWSGEECVSQDASEDVDPALAETMDGDVWLVWSSLRPGADYEVYWSIFDGAGWSAAERLTYDAGADTGPSVVQAPNGLVWVAWSSDRSAGNADIYCQVFDGLEWWCPERLTTDGGADLDPALVSLGDGTLWVIWASDRSGHFEIYYRVFDGAAWSEDLLLAPSSDNAEAPTAVATAGGDAWLAYRKGNGIYYKMLVAGQWSDEARLYPGLPLDHDPALAQAADGRVWLAYASTRDENTDIYAQWTNGSVTSGVGVQRDGATVPGLALGPARPNPFSAETRIGFRLTSPSEVDLAIYSVLGRRIRTLAAGRFEPGEHSVTWDGRSDAGTQVPSGVYFCRLSMGRTSLAGKVLLLR